MTVISTHLFRLSSDEDQEDEQAATEESDISLLDDGIEDLDPDLAAFLTESTATSINQPEKITIKLQYVIPKQQLVNEAFERIAEKLQKPMKVIVMNVIMQKRAVEKKH